ncbi:MAG TPA: hypothetical protein VIW24_19395 [Aldersonia sp.]
MPISERAYELGDQLLRRIDRLKSLLLQTTSTTADEAVGLAMSQEIRAACIIYSIAELEGLTRNLLQLANAEVNNRRHRAAELRPCMRSLIGHSRFESLRETRDAEKVWAHRDAVTNYDNAKEVAILPVVPNAPQPPLDGRTLTPSHFDRIWVVYGIRTPWYPTVSCRMTLSKLSGLRNDLAHANIPFGEVFSQPGVTPPDVERYINEISEIAICLVSGFADHIDNRSYLSAVSSTASVH